MGGDGGGGDGGFAERQAAEEARKSALRRKISSLYGIDNPEAAALPDRSKFITGTSPPVYDYGSETPMLINGGEPIYDDAAYQAALDAAKSSAGGDAIAKAAREAMAKEEADLEGANRSFYTDELGRSYDKARRQNRFGLADRGLLGGSQQIDSERELSLDNTLGATRIEDEVRGAVGALRNQREAERLNAIQLVNAGSGEEAVSGAQAGLQRALQNASSLRKADIASDLFGGVTDSFGAANNAMLGQLAYQQYQNKLRTFYGSEPKSARVTGTG
jgi:hypothetical protein